MSNIAIQMNNFSMDVFILGKKLTPDCSKYDVKITSNVP